MKAYEVAADSDLDDPATLSVEAPGRRLASARLGGSFVLGGAFWGWAGPAAGHAVRRRSCGSTGSACRRPSSSTRPITCRTRWDPALWRGAQPRRRPERAAGPQGNTHIFSAGGEFVAHPPLGKLFIAFGEWTFGAQPVRLAVLGRADRLAGDPAAGPDRPPDDPVDAARLRRGPAAGAGRPGIRDEPDGAAGHLPDVLGAGRVRLPGRGPGPSPGPGWPRRLRRGTPARSAGRRPADPGGGGSRGGGWAPGSASAWPWPPSGTRSGTCSASPGW